MNTSPRTSRMDGMDWFPRLSLSGIALIVLRFCVISSPVMPSPRVEPCANIPFM